MDKNIIQSHEIELSVQFYDLDPLRIVWHGNYLKYFDAARSALFDKLNIDFYNYFTRTQYIFPVTKTSTKHILPLKYRDKFVCSAAIVSARNKIIMDFRIRRIQDNKLCAKGRSEQVAVNAESGKLEYEIPEDIRKALGF